MRISDPQEVSFIFTSSFFLFDNMNFKTLLLVLFISISVFGHAPASDLLVADATPAMVDGNLNTVPGEWDDATGFGFGGVQAWIKSSGCDQGPPCMLFVAYRMPYLPDESNPNMAYLFLDDLHDAGPAPMPDDQKCLVDETNTGGAWRGDGVTWLFGGSCFAAAGFDGPDFWVVEFEMPMEVPFIDTIPQFYKGAMFAHSIGPLEAVGAIAAWPAAGDMMLPLTWGDIHWPNPNSGDIAAGTNNPGNHDWTHGGTDPWNEMLQLQFTVPAGDSWTFNSLTLQSAGTGNDAADISSVDIFVDNNNNGQIDVGEPLIGSGTFPVDNGQLTINLMAPGNNFGPGNTNLLVAFQMAATAPIGSTYSFTLTAVNAVNGAGNPIAFNGLPLASGTKTITAVPDSSASTGGNNPSDHGWYPGGTDPYNEMLQLQFTVPVGDTWTTDWFTVRALGTGDHAIAIANLTATKDTNGNGIVDANEFTSAPADPFLVNNPERIRMFLPPDTIFTAGTHTILFSFVMSSNTVVGATHQLRIEAIDITDKNGNAVTLAGLPITSATKTILAQPVACSGTSKLKLIPSSTNPKSTVTATVSGLAAGCQGYDAEIHQYFCGGPKIGICTLDAEGSCSKSFKSPGFNGAYVYFACIDTDLDNNFNSAGEKDYAILTLSGTSYTNNCIGTNCGGCLNQPECVAHGACEWKGTYCTLSSSPTGTTTTTTTQEGDVVNNITNYVAENPWIIILLGAVAGLLVIMIVLQVVNLMKK